MNDIDKCELKLAKARQRILQLERLERGNNDEIDHLLKKIRDNRFKLMNQIQHLLTENEQVKFELDVAREVIEMYINKVSR